MPSVMAYNPAKFAQSHKMKEQIEKGDVFFSHNQIARGGICCGLTSVWAAIFLARPGLDAKDRLSLLDKHLWSAAAIQITYEWSTDKILSINKSTPITHPIAKSISEATTQFGLEYKALGDEPTPVYGLGSLYGDFDVLDMKINHFYAVIFYFEIEGQATYGVHTVGFKWNQDGINFFDSNVGEFNLEKGDMYFFFMDLADQAYLGSVVAYRMFEICVSDQQKLQKAV